jgi:competence ComEA-like helix-hairpin-helix protein
LTSSKTDGSDKLALVRSLGETKKAEGHLLLGYDDLYSIQYFGENLRPYWNRNGNETIQSQFAKADKEYDAVMDKCAAFDANLMKEATEVGGRKYAELCALAYRQAIAAHKLVEAPNKDLLFLSKENFSNGSIGTVDITYPSAPLFLVYNPELAKGLMNHIFYYSESGKWNKPFAAHDVGTYPLANGQTYGGDMPIEESGNMLILSAAIAIVEGNADYAQKHWDVLTTWTDYLAQYGLDPENQLCTDDFAGHFAHNANLSIKAILGVASYGYLADKLGKKEVAENLELAMAKVPEALNDGDNSGNLGLEEIQGSSVENPSGTVGRDTGSFGDGVGDDTRINLNTADAGQLSTLSGIGQSKAEAIVAYREEHGDFASIEEIMNVEGIKEGTFSKIKDKISTG